MTERKPPGMTFTSWIDKQIQEATERGAFEDLPGAGKPLPSRPDDDGMAWIREKLAREGVSADELLPPPLKLRKESARLAENVHLLASEAEVREAVAELNKRIVEWRRIPVGPPIFVALVKPEEMVARWRAAQPGRPAVPAQPQRAAPDAGRQPPGRRWWRRREDGR
jgi:hypothetical protein